MRIGVVGCGYWGSKHVRVLHGLAEVDQVAAIDPREDVRASLVATFPGLVAFPSLDAAVGHVDAVVLATPPATHASIGLQAIDAGIHVLVEKPLATSIGEAESLIAAAESAGVTLMVGHTFEFNPAVWQLRDMLQGDELGDIFYIDSARLNLGLYQPDVNVVWDLAPHDLSIMNFLLGSTPTHVEAWGSRHAHTALEDVAYLRVYYGDVGVTAQVHVSWLDPCKVRRVTVVGSEKMAVYNDLNQEERILVYDKGVTTNGNEGSGASLSYKDDGVTAPEVEFDEPLKLEDQHFIRSIVEGRVPATNGQSGLAVVETLVAAERSMRTGRSVEIRPAARVLANDHALSA